MYATISPPCRTIYFFLLDCWISLRIHLNALKIVTRTSHIIDRAEIVNDVTIAALCVEAEN